MRVQIFCFTQPYFSWTWKINPAEVQSTISEWIAQNQDVAIREINHDTVASFWYPPQLFVSIYYENLVIKPATKQDTADVCN